MFPIGLPEVVVLAFVGYILFKLGQLLKRDAHR